MVLTQNSPDLEAELRKAGIKITVRKPPSSTILLELDRHRKNAFFTPTNNDNSQVKFYPDASLHQVVIAMVEPAREVTRAFAYTLGQQTLPGGGNIGFAALLKSKTADIEAGRHFPVHFPGAEVEYTLDKAVEYEAYNEHFHVAQVTVTAHVSANESCFLLGHDEEHMFISALPEMVRSVKRAHDVLRPPEVPKGSPRVGEFFFVPVSEEISDRLDERVKNAPVVDPRAIGESENHYAHCLFMNQSVWDTPKLIDKNAPINTEYAIGFIVDEEGRHLPLWLDEWHRIYRNTEIEPPEGVEGSAWD